MFTKGGRPDLLIFTSVIILVSIGLIMVFSASSVMGLSDFRDPYHYVKRQSILAAVGIVAMFFLMKVDYRIYRVLAFPGLVVSFILLILVLIIGQDIGGAKRWINLGFFNLQASEVAKLAMVNFAAVYITNKRDKLRKFWTGLFPVLAILGI